MSNSVEILKRFIQAIQEQQGYQAVDVQLDSDLVNDLGFASLDIAQLVAMMEGELGMDPFSTGATLNQVATVRDMAGLYTPNAS